MAKPADRLREWDAEIRSDVEGSPHTETRTTLGDTAALLDECERNIRALIDEETVTVHIGYDNGPWGGNYLYGEVVRTDAPAFVAIRATLAKLRGEG